MAKKYQKTKTNKKDRKSNYKYIYIYIKLILHQYITINRENEKKTTTTMQNVNSFRIFFCCFIIIRLRNNKTKIPMFCSKETTKKFPFKLRQ